MVYTLSNRLLLYLSDHHLPYKRPLIDFVQNWLSSCELIILIYIIHLSWAYLHTMSHQRCIVENFSIHSLLTILYATNYNMQMIHNITGEFIWNIWLYIYSISPLWRVISYSLSYEKIVLRNCTIHSLLSLFGFFSYFGTIFIWLNNSAKINSYIFCG